jgi:hypothetical protein
MPAPRGTVTGRVTTNQATQATLLTAYQTVIDEQRKAFEQELADERATFAAEQAEQLASWKKELARIKEEDNYNFNRDKRDRDDKLKDEIASRVAAVTERETKVKERELAIGDAEKTIAKLQETVVDIPNIADRAEKVGYTKGLADASKEAQADARIKEAETNAAKSVLQNKIDSLTATVNDLSDTISTLRADLVAANSRVETIANNAVTASSKQQVVVQNPFAMQQSK